MICDYGCGKEAKYLLEFKNKTKKWCCCKSYKSCEEIRLKKSISSKGRNVWNKGKFLSNETKLKQSLVRKGVKKPPRSEEHKRKLAIANLGRIIPKNQIDRQRLKIIDKWKDPTSIYNSPSYRKKLKDYMNNGHALKMIKAIKKISKEEIKLRDMVKELYSSAEFQYPVFNYSLDVAIPEHKIAIEYDGYYHFCSEENKEYHKQRQEKIEKEGWKFYRVTMFDKFPSLEQIKNNIFEIVERNSNSE